MARHYAELLPSNMYQPLATEYAYQAMTSSYIDPTDLLNMKDFVVKSICGTNMKLTNDSVGEFERLTEHFNKKRKDGYEQSLLHNCKVLANGLELHDNAWKVIRFVLVVSTNGGLLEFIEHTLPTYVDSLFASMIGIGEDELINISLALTQTGIFQHCSLQSLTLTQIPKGLIDSLTGEKAVSYTELISPLIQIQPSSELNIRDMDHLVLDSLIEFLTIAVNQSLVGVSILIYGESGTGKTQLSRLLADIIGASLIAIKPLGQDINQSERDYGISTEGPALRLQHLRLVQNIIAQDEKTLLSIEEAEDILSLSSKAIEKNSLTDVLETNLTPCIFLTNHIDVIDPAILRRFTFIKQVNIPSNIIMSRIINKTTKGLRLSKPFKAMLEAKPYITPANITNAAFVCQTLGIVGKQAEATVLDIIDETLSACGFDEHKVQYKPQLPFNIDSLNIQGGNKTIDQIAKAVNNNGDLKVLLYGASGTGKTAVVNFLAAQANTELITVRCSDVLGGLVGSTEKNISNKFKEAEEQKAILFFDEIDSLLQSRDMAKNSWEVTQVNELLTQIEAFNQPFFAASNYVEKLDSAMARRFDFKLHFEYLTSPQVLKFYNHLLGKSVLSEKIREQLLTLKLLTPGDFAICKRRQKISTTKLSPTECLNILTQENNRKQQTKAIGFIN